MLLFRLSTYCTLYRNGAVEWILPHYPRRIGPRLRPSSRSRGLAELARETPNRPKAAAICATAAPNRPHCTVSIGRALSVRRWRASASPPCPSAPVSTNACLATSLSLSCGRSSRASMIHGTARCSRLSTTMGCEWARSRCCSAAMCCLGADESSSSGSRAVPGANSRSGPPPSVSCEVILRRRVESPSRHSSQGD